MIRISQLKLPVDHKQWDLKKKAAKLLRVSPEEIRKLNVVRRSVDARKKEEILFSYTVDIEAKKESQIVKKAKSPQITIVKEEVYEFPKSGKKVLSHPPVIVGSGPAGLFCGLMLAKAGYCPLILERGEDVESRQKKVEAFWRTGILDPWSNVQFGEGGAGTFSDGKLNTMIKDPGRRNQKVLELFVEHGADPEILYVQKPHIGTDVLSQVVKNMRKQIEELGGRVRFGAQVTDLMVKDGHIEGVVVNQKETLPAAVAVLAIGHSARDTFSMLYDKKVPMASKAFAVGLRIQHPQKMINESQYGAKYSQKLGAASYKVTWQSVMGRGVYSFCMCPGGYVVDASSETGRLAVNGMSNHDRGGENANSALIVTVTPDDFPGQGPLSGVEFQRRLEEKAYECGGGKIPVQLYGDFKEGKRTHGFGDVGPEIKGRYEFGNLRDVLPEALSLPLMEGMEQFEGRIRGFARYDSILAGVESRTSSPVRIHRDQGLESEIKGLYPCGEGAGYAGGITSAAMDGIRVAEAIAGTYGPIK
ncbi:MAG: FAD-dependent oxidoreductase [Hungatella sp.]|nr:FAD-dependent oxidoreductase [Hungatella sp.]